jgi:hypothetical protein
MPGQIRHIARSHRETRRSVAPEGSAARAHGSTPSRMRHIARCHRETRRYVAPSRSRPAAQRPRPARSGLCATTPSASILRTRWERLP